MKNLCRLLLVITMVTLGCLAVVRPTSAAVGSPRPTARHVLGPGTTHEPGFVGYVTASGAALGVARLPDGRYGICLDTGRRVWPRRHGHDAYRHDPRMGYLASRYLPAARRDPVTAAALWWAVGLDLGRNSGRARMRSHLAAVRAEAPEQFRRIVHRHGVLLHDLRAHVSPAGRYLARRPVLGAGRITGLGIRSSSGAAMPGIFAKLRLYGGVFSDGSHTWRGPVPVAGAPGLGWRRLGGVRVRLTVRYAGIPARGYLLVRSGARFQRVAVAARTSAQSTTTALPALPRPAVHTIVSSAQTIVGGTVSDSVTVMGAGGARLSGRWRLLGPVPPGASGCGDANWASTPTAGSGSFTVSGDGTYQVGAMTVADAGCFTYVERLDASPSTRATGWTAVGQPSETTLARARPTVSTQVSRRNAVVGVRLHDLVTVTGLPAGTTATLHWRLLGPVAPRGASCRGVSWAGAPVRAQSARTVGNGGLVVGWATITRGGCYTYQERLDATALSAGTAWTTPGAVPESTTVGPRSSRVPDHPQVDTGGSRPAARGLRTAAGRASVHIPGSVEDTPLSAMRFHNSILTPPSVGVGGWWSGGAQLNALVGTTIVAGHVSDDHGRLGPFARLHRTRVGTVVTTTSAGVSTRWRVTAVLSYDRRHLPRELFAQHLVRRLVLITCTDKVSGPGGSFHYRRNLVVIAIPLRT